MRVGKKPSSPGPRKPTKAVKPPRCVELQEILRILRVYEEWFAMIFLALSIPSVKGGPVRGRGQRGTETKNGPSEKPRSKRLRAGGIF